MNVYHNRTTDRFEIAKRFLSCRKLVELTQDDVVQLAKEEVSATTVSRLENGKVYEICLGKIYRVAEAIDVHPDYLLCHTDEIRTFRGGLYLY